MLQTNPKKRPNCEKLLSNGIIRKKIEMYFEDEEYNSKNILKRY